MLKERLKRLPYAIEFGFVFVIVIAVLIALLVVVDLKYFSQIYPRSDMGGPGAWAIILSTFPVFLLANSFHLFQIAGWLFVSVYVLLSIIYLFLVGCVIDLFFQLLGYLKRKLGFGHLSLAAKLGVFVLVLILIWVTVRVSNEIQLRRLNSNTFNPSSSRIPH